MGKHMYLEKHNDDLVSHCKCERALVGYPPQLDCPWCGCGWLFTCIECRKAFTFARAIEIDEPWEDLARRDIRGAGLEVSGRDISDWIAFMKEYTSEAILGHQYVAFDGRLIATDKDSLDFDGWHSAHHLSFVPHVAALKDRSIIESVLSSTDYWESHAVDELSLSSLGQPAIRDREKKWWEFWK